MNKVLPIIIICSVGITACVALLIAMLCKKILIFVRRRRQKEEFDIDESTLTVRLDKKDFRK